MKKYIFPAVAVLALLASCAKEEAVIVEEPTLEKVEIRATINNEATKTDYDLSGSIGYFHWTGQETIGRLWHTSSFGHDPFVSTTEANSNETSLVFSGSYSANQTDYFMYPIWNGTTKTGIGWSSNPFNLYLHESMVYNADAPLKDVVPMIGKVDGSGEISFVPVSGIIAVTVKNLPSTATKITLSSGMALSGNYRLTSTPADYAAFIDEVMTTGLTTGLAWDAGNYNGTKSYTFSGLDRNSHVFYFPVSVATVGTYDDRYSGMTITIYEGDNILQTVKTTKKITVNRGEIVKLPEMDLAKATKVAVTGTSQQFYAYLSSVGPDASVKFAVANSAEAAISAAGESSKIVNVAGIDNKVEVSDVLSETGMYHLGYKVFDSANNVLASGSIPVYFISSSDATRAGTYKMAFHDAIDPATLPDNGDDTITFSVSDDPTKGNFMITQAFGFCNEVSKSTHSSLAAYDFSKFQDGSPIYGFYNPSASDPKLVFSDISKQVFYYDASNHPHFICEYGTDTLRFAFDSNAYNSTTYDIICWGGYIMNCYDNTSSYDMFVQKFAANKL